MGKLKNKKTVNILGEEYSIEYKTLQEDKKLEELAGYTDFFSKEIVIEDRDRSERSTTDTANLKEYENKVLKHEIIHAYLYESGLDVNSSRAYAWATNEEMIDWFAIQSSKIYKTYEELGIL